MSTANSIHADTSISNEAYELLGCFVDGFDDIVYDIATQMARERCGESVEPVAIEVEDIRAAADAVMNAIRTQIASGKFPIHLEKSIEEMVECCEIKANQSED